MDDSKNNYIKVDDNKVINEKCIKWIKKMDECLAVCTKSNGCYIKDTHKVCKINNDNTFLANFLALIFINEL